MLFSGNEVPGPGQYTTTNKGGTQALKNWQTNIGAFGTTEKRFLQSNSVTTAATNVVPGPGEYDVNKIGINVESKFVDQRVRGKSVKVKKPEQGNSVFKSTTGRLFENELNQIKKTQVGMVGQYETQIDKVGKGPTQGGAPNNFLLMKNERLVAPFQSTVTRFKSQDQPKVAETANMVKQSNIINSLHGLAGAG